MVHIFVWFACSFRWYNIIIPQLQKKYPIKTPSHLRPIKTVGPLEEKSPAKPLHLGGSGGDRRAPSLALFPWRFQCPPAMPARHEEKETYQGLVVEAEGRQNF